MTTLTLPAASDRPAESASPMRVGKILCIGKNYAKHAAEMKSEVPRQPIVFLKPPTAVIGNGGQVVLPPASENVHHEVELVAVIGTGGRFIDAADALDHVVAYAVGLDMTARDLQRRAKDGGLPWSVAKGFDTFAPLGPLVPAAEIEDPQALTLRLTINGEVRQEGSTADMVFPVADLVAYCSTVFTLEPGDLIYTGTPEGVGPVSAGDTLVAEATGCPTLSVTVTRHRGDGA
jgi:2-keto-4-pentenoate hydratase/2-oxohepta-3-ene-1,7-dioic acid hydratase in catechol pathway